MQKLFLFILVFNFSVINLFSQEVITPVGTTRTSVSKQNEVDVINISRPNSNGLSNNTYLDFNIPQAGVIFNNSDAAGISRLAGQIEGNANYNAGDSANLILNQVNTNSNNSSLLQGYGEVFGNKAGIIIANPNGITCAGCGFYNTDRVDLIVGTSHFNDSGELAEFHIGNGKLRITDTYESQTENILTIIKSTLGFDGSEVDFLNLIAQTHQIDGRVIANKKIRVLSGDDSYDHKNFTVHSVNSKNNTISGFAIDISERAGLQAGSIELITTSKDLGSIESEGEIMSNQEITIKTTKSVLKANLKAIGNISIDASDNVKLDEIITHGNLTVHAGDDFTNSGIISTNNFDTTVGDRFLNNSSGNISVDYFKIRVGFSSIVLNFFNDDFQNNGTIIANNLDIETNDDVDNNGEIHANNATIKTGDVFRNDGTIKINTLKLTVGDDLNNYGTIYVDHLDATVDDKFYNSSNNSIIVNNFAIRSGFSDTTEDIIGDNLADDDFENDGTIIANSLNIEVNDDVDNNGEIHADDFDIVAGDIFFNDDNAMIIADDFDIRAGFSSSVINTIYSDFENDGTIIANNLDIETNNDVDNNGEIHANNAVITVGDDFENDGTIIANSLNIEVNDDADNNGEIHADDFDIVAGDIFFNDDNAMIIADDFDIRAGFSSSVINTIYSDFENDGTIIANNLDIETNNDVDNNGEIHANNAVITVGDDFQNNGTIIANILNIEVNDDADNNGEIHADDFDIVAGDIFFNDDNAMIIADDFDIRAGFSSSVINTIYSDFENDGTIIANNLDIETNNDVDNNGEIHANNAVITVGDDFENDGTIIANILNIEVNDDADNNGEIHADDFDIVAGDIFFNDDNAMIIADDFDIRAGFSSSVINTIYSDFENDGDIDAGDLSIETNNDIDNNGNIKTNNLTVNVGGAFSDNGNITYKASKNTNKEPSVCFLFFCNNKPIQQNSSLIVTSPSTPNASSPTNPAILSPYSPSLFIPSDPNYNHSVVVNSLLPIDISDFPENEKTTSTQDILPIGYIKFSLGIENDEKILEAIKETKIIEILRDTSNYIAAAKNTKNDLRICSLIKIHMCKAISVILTIAQVEKKIINTIEKELEKSINIAPTFDQNLKLAEELCLNTKKTTSCEIAQLFRNDQAANYPKKLKEYITEIEKQFEKSIACKKTETECPKLNYKECEKYGCNLFDFFNTYLREMFNKPAEELTINARTILIAENPELQNNSKKLQEALIKDLKNRGFKRATFANIPNTEKYADKYHCDKNEDVSVCIKLVKNDGSEIVLKNGVLDKNNKTKGTFNFSLNSLKHCKYDIYPYVVTASTQTKDKEVKIWQEACSNI